MIPITTDCIKGPILENIPQAGGSMIIGQCGTLPKPQREGNNMPPKNSYPFNGEQVTGESVEVETINEPWANYQLADGTTVKVKLVMLDAVRLDTYNETNDPVYQFQFQQIIGVVVPEALKRRVQ